METPTLTLAPAAGGGIGKILADRLLADPTFVDSMIAAVLGGLKATRSYYDKGVGGVVTEPDARVQIQAFALVLAHMEGEPVKRIIHQHLGGDGGKVAVLDALAESPALAESVARVLENSKVRRRKNGKRSGPELAGEALPVVD